MKIVKFVNLSLVFAGFISGVAFVVSCGSDESTNGKIVNNLAQAAESVMNALQVAFDPSASTLQSQNVQDAIVEVDNKINATQQAINDLTVNLTNNKTCPVGMTNLFDNFCIENNSRAAASFNDAALTCLQAGRNLCSGFQWNVSCVNNSTHPTIVNMINASYEWTNDLQSNSGATANVQIIGKDTCSKTSHVANHDTSLYEFRCCSNLN